MTVDDRSASGGAPVSDELASLDRGISQSASDVARMGYAGFWRRLAAFLIDYVIQAIMMVILAIAGLFITYWASLSSGGSFESAAATGSVLLYVVFVPVLWIYHTLLESSRLQATIGKRLLGIIVTDMNNRRIGFGRANGRFWCKALCLWTLGIGFLMIAFTKKKQGMHDKIADTLVIRRTGQGKAFA
jgi:uncharacterized RDD family membrane protein YckC